MSKKIYGVPVATPLSPKKIVSAQIYTGSGEMPEGYTFQIDPEGESSCVKSVNGIAPDENGNVEVAGSTSGGLTAEQVQAMIDAALGGIENGTY